MPRWTSLIPAHPSFLLLNPQLLKAQLRPVLDYARSERWKFAFRAARPGHVSAGQRPGLRRRRRERRPPDAGRRERQHADHDGRAGRSGRKRGLRRLYWPLLKKWAAYLEEKGLDPENQLCTDDFAGHLAHNTNLSLKAIIALAAYAKLAAQLDDQDEAAEIPTASSGDGRQWIAMADDGDHYRLAFDKPGTWSQKYNLVWDRLLGLNLFPPEVARKEIGFYKTKQNAFGLPLDNRTDLHEARLDPLDRHARRESLPTSLPWLTAPFASPTKRRPACR